MNKPAFDSKVSNILSVLGNPFRIKIAIALGSQEACVCHLEQLLKKRQAYISQHLMVMRDAGLLDTRRDGKYIYYRLANKEALDLIQAAAHLAGVDPNEFPDLSAKPVLAQCECPKCGNDEKIPAQLQNQIEAAAE
jgi:DNA-binding transcriptional ArsR family regulator